MSAWPQAVWIVKKMQKSFNFTQDISNYTHQLNELNNRVNDLIDDFNDYQSALEASSSSFFAMNVNGNPDSSKVPQNLGQGTIWFTVDRYNNGGENLM